MGTSNEDFHNDRITKRRRIVYEEDRISNLPEGIISHILSCLPTRDAVRTSTLSQSWEHRWTSIYNIEVNDETKCLAGDAETTTSSSLLSSVDRVLLSTQNSRIVTFRISSRKKYESIHIQTWISEVLRRKVQVLEIETFECESVVLPRILSRSPSLTELKLLFSCTMKAAVLSSLLHLKILSIGGGKRITEIVNTQSPDSGKLLLTFPVLEVLELNSCKWLNVKSVEIKAPSLTRFTAQSTYELVNDCEIKIYGAKLDEFGSIGFGAPDNFVLYSPSLYYATLDHRKTTELLGLRTNMIVKTVPGLRCLKLSGQVVKVLIQEKPQRALPNFDRLEILHLSTGCDNEWLELISACPSLVSLKLNVLRSKAYDYELVKPLPPCISVLKEVSLLHFVGNEAQLEMAQFFLKNANNLVRMFIYVGLSSGVSEINIKDMLSVLPRSSSNVSFVVGKRMLYPWFRTFPLQLF